MGRQKMQDPDGPVIIKGARSGWPNDHYVLVLLGNLHVRAYPFNNRRLNNLSGSYHHLSSLQTIVRPQIHFITVYILILHYHLQS